MPSFEDRLTAVQAAANEEVKAAAHRLARSAIQAAIEAGVSAVTLFDDVRMIGAAVGVAKAMQSVKLPEGQHLEARFSMGMGSLGRLTDMEDPPACSSCGLQAGACAFYPNCPGSPNYIPAVIPCKPDSAP